MNRYRVTVNGKEYEVALLERAGAELVFTIDGKRFESCVEGASVSCPSSASPAAPLAVTTRLQPSNNKMHVGEANVYAPMPGIVVQLLVQKGERVTLGQTVAIIEAMKMENNILAAREGKVTEVHVAPGQEISNSQLLISVQCD